MPRFTTSKTFSFAGLRAFLRLDAGVGEVTASSSPPEVPWSTGEEERLAEGLYKARRTSQKRAERVSALKSRLAGLEADRAEDKRLIRYLLSDAFERYGPWVTGVEVHGEVYGRASRHASPRLAEFYEAFPGASRGRVLEPGSLEGAMTVELAKRAREVVGLEVRPESLQRAEFLRGLCDANNITFHATDLERDDLASYGTFDAVFCCGLLYHLPNPRAFVGRAATISPNLYLDTQYAPEDDPDRELTERDGLRGWIRAEDPADPQSGVSDTAFWPTLKELYRLLSESGYGRVETLSFPPDNRHGPRVHIAASRD